jgi:hypothetical protein
LNSRDTLAFRHKVLSVVDLATGDGDESGISRFRQGIGDDARNHARANDTESNFRQIHRISLLLRLGRGADTTIADSGGDSLAAPEALLEGPRRDHSV